MKKQSWVILLILIILIIAGVWSFKHPASKNLINQDCTNQGDYCVYNNIPSYLKYTSPDEEIPESLIANTQEVLSQYFKRIGSENKDLNEAFGLDPTKWVCSNGDKILVVNYFYLLCEEGIDGCGYSRTAFICGDTYFIEQYADWSGPVIYGPFSI